MTVDERKIMLRVSEPIRDGHALGNRTGLYGELSRMARRPVMGLAAVTVAFVLMTDFSASARPRLARAGNFSGVLAKQAVKVAGVKAGPFAPDKLKVWHWQWSNPVIVPSKGEYQNIYAPEVLRTTRGTYLYYHGWENRLGVDDRHDRIFLAYWYDGWQKREPPILAPAFTGESLVGCGEWHVDDPCVVESNGRYYMLHTDLEFPRSALADGRTINDSKDWIAVAVSDDGIRWGKKGPIRTDIPGHDGLYFANPQLWNGGGFLHVGIAGPSVVWTGDVWRLCFDRPVPNSSVNEETWFDYPEAAAVYGRFVSYAETRDPDFVEWSFKADLQHVPGRIDVDVDVARVNGWYFKVTASFHKGLFGAVSRDGVAFEWVDPYAEAGQAYLGAMLPPYGSEVFPKHDRHAYDVQVVSPEIVHDKDCVYALMYGASPRDHLDWAQICEVYLQRKIEFRLTDGRL